MPQTLGEILSGLGPGNPQAMPNMMPWYIQPPIQQTPMPPFRISRPVQSVFPKAGEDEVAAALAANEEANPPKIARNAGQKVKPAAPTNTARGNYTPIDLSVLMPDTTPQPQPYRKRTPADQKPDTTNTARGNYQPLDFTNLQNFLRGMLPKPGNGGGGTISMPDQIATGDPTVDNLPPGAAAQTPDQFANPEMRPGLGLGDMLYDGTPSQSKPASGGTEEVESDKGGGSSTAERGAKPDAPASASAAGQTPFDPRLGAFLLQTGLSLMTPSWGGPMANIGKAIGEGAEAVGRATETKKTDEQNRKKQELEEEKLRVSAMKKGQGSSSASKRLKSKTPAQQFAEGMSPEAALYFSQRLKGINKPEEDEDGNATTTPEQRFSSLLAETKNIDMTTRMGRGMLKSAEVTDGQIAAAAKDPNAEKRLLQATAADPTQASLMANRLAAAKAATGGGNK